MNNEFKLYDNSILWKYFPNYIMAHEGFDRFISLFWKNGANHSITPLQTWFNRMEIHN